MTPLKTFQLYLWYTCSLSSFVAQPKKIQELSPQTPKRCSKRPRPSLLIAGRMIRLSNQQV